MTNQAAIFGGGCFWCTEATFQKLKGVVEVTPGYAGGQKPDPTYEQVCVCNTGHAEVIKIEFDPDQISYKNLLEVFFAVHDPTTQNRQGNDIGTQYRSIILTTSNEQKTEAKKFIEELETQKIYDNKIITEIKPLDNFYEAEEYHKNYYKKNPNQAYCQVVINPKLQKLREKYAELLK